MTKDVKTTISAATFMTELRQALTELQGVDDNAENWTIAEFDQRTKGMDDVTMSTSEKWEFITAAVAAKLPEKMLYKSIWGHSYQTLNLEKEDILQDTFKYFVGREVTFGLRYTVLKMSVVSALSKEVKRLCKSGLITVKDTDGEKHSYYNRYWHNVPDKVDDIAFSEAKAVLDSLEGIDKQIIRLTYAGYKELEIAGLLHLTRRQVQYSKKMVKTKLGL